MANGKELTPYTFRSPALPDMQPVEVSDDELSGMGVWFLFPASELTENLDTVEVWYEHRDDVVLVDSGVSRKKQIGFIIMEWEGHEPDRLFLDILRTDETIIDYGIYEVQA